MRPQLEAIWRKLHEMPEPAFEEKRTAGFIADQLRRAGFRVREGVAGTGVVAQLEPVDAAAEGGVAEEVADWKAAAGQAAGKEAGDAAGRSAAPVLALRADMDALPHNVGGQQVFVHSCGHDAHCAMVMGAGMLLARECPAARGRLRLLFQPAEEAGLGAQRMLEAGAVDGVDVLIGIHLRPAAECRLGQATPCVMHAGGRTLRYSLHGRPAHTGRPHLGANVADALALATLAANSVKPDPALPGTVNVIFVSTGDGPTGVIPDHGGMAVNIRAETDDAADELRQRVHSAVTSAAGSVGVEAMLEGVKEMPAPSYHPDAVALARQAIEKVLGEENVIEAISTPGCEDFHWYSRRTPGIKAAYIGLGADLKPGLHHPDAAFDLRTLVYGTAILAQAAADYFRRQPEE